MKQLVNQNKTAPEATRIRITTRSGEEEWHRAQTMKKVWNMKYARMNNKQE